MDRLECRDRWHIVSVCRVDILFMMFLQSPAAVAVFLTRTAVDVVCTAAVTGSARQESSAGETAATGPVVGHQRCGVCYFTDIQGSSKKVSCCTVSTAYFF